MAGGIWLSQNKTRPGAYINFTAVPKSSMTTGDRGIVALALPLKWGASGKLIEVLSTEMLTGDSKKKVGLTATDTEAKLLAGALSYCYKALVYNTNQGGMKASATIGGIVATAKYAGTLGNKLNVAISNDSGVYEVLTYLDGETVDTQRISEISELEDNDYIVFSQATEQTTDQDTGTQTTTPITAIVETAGTALEGGTDGVTVEETAYTNFLKLLAKAHWQTMVCFSENAIIKKTVVDFVKRQRDDEGNYVQGVVADYDGADHEGIINSISGAVIDDVTKKSLRLLLQE